MEALKKTGIDKNTIVFFLSDNGGGKPSAAYPSSNYPLKGYKGQFYEGGIRVPFVARWNGVFTGGSKYNEPVISMDITATALALAGGNPDESKLDGKNLIPYIIGKKTTAPHERLFWRASEGKDGAIRKGNYKLKFTKSGGSVELYNLTTDIGEQHDMSNEQPELVKTLLTEWKAWNIELKPSAWRIVPEKEWTQPRYQPPLWKEEKK
jgi:arylsulfatase A-like enzyme